MNGDPDEFDIPADDAPVVISVEALIETPEGMVRSGDEVRLPSNWTDCRACGVECPIDHADCWHCGEPLAE
jgi:hypothetical protein